jgi:hypothetical protein
MRSLSVNHELSCFPISMRTEEQTVAVFFFDMEISQVPAIMSEYIFTQYIFTQYNILSEYVLSECALSE